MIVDQFIDFFKTRPALSLKRCCDAAGIDSNGYNALARIVREDFISVKDAERKIKEHEQALLPVLQKYGWDQPQSKGKVSHMFV